MVSNSTKAVLFHSFAISDVYLPLSTSPLGKTLRIFVYLSLRTLNAATRQILRRNKIRSRGAFYGGAFNVHYKAAHVEFGARGDVQTFGDLGPAQPVAALQNLFDLFRLRLLQYDGLIRLCQLIINPISRNVRSSK